MNGTSRAGLLTLVLVLPLAACGPGLDRAWEVSVGNYSQTPAVAPDGTLVTYNYDTFSGKITYTGLEPADGSTRWTVSHDWGDTRPKSLDGDGNLIVNGRDRVFGLDPADGSEAWSVDEPGVGFLQAVDGDRIYLARQNQDGNTDHKLVAVEGGAVQWTIPAAELLAGLAVGADGTLYAAGTELAAISPEGEVEWSVALPGTAGSLALDRDRVVLQLGPGADFAGGLAAVDRADGALLWTSASTMSWEPILGSDGTIYGSSAAGVVAVDGGTGEPLWQAVLNCGPVALGADDRLYGMAMMLEDEELPDLGSKLHFVVLSSSSGEVLWKELQNEAAEVLNHAPSFDGQRVHFGAGYFNAYVYAFGGGPGLAPGPWPRTGADNGYRYREQ